MGKSFEDEDFKGNKANEDFGQSFGRSPIDTAGNQRRAANAVKNQDKYVEKLQRHVRWGGSRGAYAMKVLAAMNEKPAGAPGIVSAESRNAEAMQGAQDRQKTGDAARKQFDDALNEANGVSTTNGGTPESAAAIEQAAGKPNVTGQFAPGSEFDQAEKDLWSKDPKPDGIGSPDQDGNVIVTMDFKDSDKNGIDDKQDWLKRNPDYSNSGKGGQPATPTSTASPSAPQGGAKNNSKNAITSLTNKFKANKFGKDLDSMSDNDWADKKADIIKYGKSLGINEDAIEGRVVKRAPSQFDDNGVFTGKSDLRTGEQFAEDMRSGRNGEKSVVTAKDKEWMNKLGVDADKPKDAVSRYESAYNRYQKGTGSKNGAYNKEDYNEMQAIRKGANPAELRVIDRISSGKGSILSEAETPHTEGNYKGSNQAALDLYNQTQNLPRYSENDLDGKKRRNAVNNIYGKLNSLDQAKVIGSTLGKNADILAQQRKNGTIDANGQMTAKGLADNNVQYKKNQEVSAITSNSSKIRNLLKRP